MNERKLTGRKQRNSRTKKKRIEFNYKRSTISYYRRFVSQAFVLSVVKAMTPKTFALNYKKLELEESLVQTCNILSDMYDFNNWSSLK